LTSDARGHPKSHDGLAETLRIANVARGSAVKARTQAINQLRALIVSTPDRSRDMALKVKPKQCVTACAALLTCDTHPAMASLKTTLRLLARFGVGPQTAATLRVTAGDNPTRLRDESAMVALCGVGLLSASSGKVCRHRLNRGGEHQANNALWTIAMVRMRS
jgi:transposase